MRPFGILRGLAVGFVRVTDIRDYHIVKRESYTVRRGLAAKSGDVLSYSVKQKLVVLFSVLALCIVGRAKKIDLLGIVGKACRYPIIERMVDSVVCPYRQCLLLRKTELGVVKLCNAVFAVVIVRIYRRVGVELLRLDIHQKIKLLHLLAALKLGKRSVRVVACISFNIAVADGSYRALVKQNLVAY